ncbi:2-C-methyl-D-erythritol 4-phosphate cytidylyltransferase [Nocardia sp. CDC159]|uniref:2-C-methyl-D-erythritol 4-phosphate cytidylyltransferase n=1 Tax=Nocardia pulmonis TaxID=2951408 RepID=A0A9X2E4C2_9NOCA|nr:MULTISPECIES: 2-C-methyl-D-erythritol 4-phosphate cytidylyltransferase [Nocardia]MCM6772833.1 2-C-methyl-D-erythritol 4-phosphate cytidylyltransferase [Nocardia pulmonis]MCM6785864.1 2-C-methyl-D-erythritol 4-phosphate cytidylyltransferase [Nocardia sp. CDC159]
MKNSPHDASRVVALVPAAGQGVRLGAATPKAFVPVGGSPMLTHAIDGLIASGVVDRIVIMVPAELIERARHLSATAGSSIPVSVVAGGSERIDSVRAGLTAAPEATHVLVHDAARALTPPSLIARVVAELRAGRRAVVPGLPVTDTIKSVDAHGVVTGTPERAGLRAIQTPQGFEAQLLREAYALDLPATDDAGLVERLGAHVHVIPGDPMAFKITTPLDLRLAEALLAERPVAQAVPR